MKKILIMTLLGIAAMTARGADFVPEAQMKDSLLQMLADFTQYMKADFEPCPTANARGEACGCFRSGSTMMPNEDGVRTNADMGMVCAFLCRYARDRMALPAGVTWDDVSAMARQSFTYACSTHKAVRLMPCADGNYWGSTSVADHVWESSLWALSVAYTALFLWDELTTAQRADVCRLLRAECRYELERQVPTAFRGDTKAEENGWEVGVLAAALALMPGDELAPQWHRRMLEFAVGSYSHPADATDTTVVDAATGLRVADLYHGPNLYPDFTLQNHGYFHTSYQNVVIQELGEAALIGALATHHSPFTPHHPPLHHCREVCDSVLWWLALSDGELAMPNGNDWSLFLYDQLTSYSTMACMERDADALMLENLAFQMIRRRQLTTPDGSWLLRSDIGPRRMGVEAHRVMMTWLMHEQWPTAGLVPSTWDDFRRRHSAARVLTCQNVVRALTQQRFTCFSWSEGLQSYTGYFAPNATTGFGLQTTDFRLQTTDDRLQTIDFRLQTSDDRLKNEAAYNIIVPYKAHNTGNLLGWYEVEGCGINAVPAGTPRIQTDGDAWTLTGRLLTNDSALDHRFAIYSTPGNALIYIDNVRARRDVTINKAMGGLLAVSMDTLTSTVRRIETARGEGQPTTWLCIDDAVGAVMGAPTRTHITEPTDVNSVMTALLSVLYADSVRSYKAGELVDQRQVVYYSNVTAEQTAQLKLTVLDTPGDSCGVIATDPDGSRYLLLTDFSRLTSTFLPLTSHF